jgi:hypothetical protein
MGYGLPLFDPDPGKDHVKVQVGDVGYVTSGKFHRIFNLLHDGKDQFGAYGVPFGYNSLPEIFRRTHSRNGVPAGLMCSSTVVSAGIDGNVEIGAMGKYVLAPFTSVHC